MALHFQRDQPYLEITKIDILCVKIAGLCHDLGHGPFSHVFDGVFMKRMKPDSHWRHEDGSVNMFNHLLTANGIDLSEYGLSDLDKTFIEEIINGTDEAKRRGRDANKFYLYDIVNNTRSGLDVDKLDYFQRDMKYTNAAYACKFERFIELGKIMQAQPISHTTAATRSKATTTLPFHSPTSLFGSATKETLRGSPASTVTEEDYDGAYPYMICYPEKLVREAVELFALRFRLHQQVYTHTCVKKIEFMVSGFAFFVSFNCST
jgi:HD superfamily phosphohydrolase